MMKESRKWKGVVVASGGAFGFALSRLVLGQFEMAAWAFGVSILLLVGGWFWVVLS